MKKWMRGLAPGVLIGMSLAAGVVAGPVVLMPGPVDLEAGESRRQLWMVPSQDPAVPMQTTVVGQSAGGFGAMALASLNPPGVRAIIVFSGGRGGHAEGKPNNNCAPDRLVETVAEFGRTARIPMLWIYLENDTFFGPALSKRMYEAFRAAGGKVEYHLLPPFDDDGHYFVDSPKSIPIWAPIVTRFLAAHPPKTQ